VTGRLARGQSSSGSLAARSSKHTCAAGGKAATGCNGAIVAELSDRGSRLSYVAMLGGLADEEGRAISLDNQRGWSFVTVDTDSSDSHFQRSQRFLVVLQPCRDGILYSRLEEVAGSPAPEIALTPALDAFTAALPKVITMLEIVKPGHRPFVSVPIAPPCPSTKP